MEYKLAARRGERDDALFLFKALGCALCVFFPGVSEITAILRCAVVGGKGGRNIKGLGE